MVRNAFSRTKHFPERRYSFRVWYLAFFCSDSVDCVNLARRKITWWISKQIKADSQGIYHVFLTPRESSVLRPRLELGVTKQVQSVEFPDATPNPPPPPPNSCPLVPKLCKSPSLWVWERPETMMGFHSYHRLGYVAEVKGFCRCNKGL